MFSFINPIYDFTKENYKTMSNSIIIKALEQIGVKAEPSGRNDICVDGKKVSGSAYKINLGYKDGHGKKTLHHGTMMLNLNVDDL